MAQVIRYTETPVGPYDEFLMVPGAFEYGVEKEKTGKIDLVKKKNVRVTKIYVSTKESTWNGRTNWNIPKHLAHFSFTTLPNNALAISVYPHDTDGSPAESSPSSTPIFTAVYKSIPYIPSFPESTSLSKYVGMDLSLVQPPLPAGEGSSGELPGTEKWCQTLPLEYSRKTSLGWWKLRQGDSDEEDPLLGSENPDDGEKGGYKNFWAGIGKWRIEMKMEDAVIEFPEGKYWEGPKL